MKLRIWLNIGSLLLTLIVNGLANSLPLNGRLTGEISDSFPVLFTPAGYVFAIWGVIYFLLIGFAVYQALPSQRRSSRLDRIGGWFIASNVFNILWIFLWHYGLFPLTMAAMLGLLLSLLRIYTRLEIGRVSVSRAEKLFVDIPFSVYLGWISVATIANASIFLYDLGWNGGPFGPIPWTLLVILVAFMLGAAMLRMRTDIAYALVLIWAFVGIAVKQAATPVVATFALVTAALLGIYIVYALARQVILAYTAQSSPDKAIAE